MFFVQLAPFVFAQAVFAVESAEVMAAWKVLHSPPSGESDITMYKESKEALEVLRRNKPATERLIIAALSKGGVDDQAVDAAIRIFQQSEVLLIARKIVSTYQVGDASIPFIGYLTEKGEQQDMELIKKLVAFHPDSESAVRQTALMAESKNPYAQAALFELRNTTPGKWQESFWVKRFFNKYESGKSSVGNLTPAQNIASTVGITTQTQPPTAQQKARASSKPLVNDESANRWWLWAGTGAVVVAALWLLLRRLS